MNEIPFLNGQSAEIQMITRILVAYLVAAAIGWDRERAGRNAGLRTHLLVATGAAAFTVTAIYGFGDPNGLAKDAAGRVVAQIISGVGFLGAGVIWHSNDKRSHGLTTAAGIWLTAAIGMMAGAGLVIMAIFVGILSWFTLSVLKKIEKRIEAAERPVGTINPDTGEE